MNKSRILEYIAVTGLWAALVYQFIYLIVPGRLSSVTTFVMLVPLMIYWVLRERLLVWVTMIPMTNRAPHLWRSVHCGCDVSPLGVLASSKVTL